MQNWRKCASLLQKSIFNAIFKMHFSKKVHFNTLSVWDKLYQTKIPPKISKFFLKAIQSKNFFIHKQLLDTVDIEVEFTDSEIE